MNRMQQLIADARARAADTKKAQTEEARRLAEGWLEANVDALIQGVTRVVPVPRRLRDDFIEALTGAGCEVELGPHDGVDSDHDERSESCIIYHVRIP